MKKHHNDYRKISLSIIAIVLGVVAALMTSLVIMHSITISTENDMAGLIVVFWLEGIVRPMVAGFVCIIFLTIARYIIKKSTKTMLLGHKPIILILISTLVINLIITAVQLNYGLYGVY